MTDDERYDVQSKIEWEGFDYGFTNWDFSEIDDPHLHQLIREYRIAHKSLEEYVFG